MNPLTLGLALAATTPAQAPQQPFAVPPGQHAHVPQPSPGFPAGGRLPVGPVPNHGHTGFNLTLNFGQSYRPAGLVLTPPLPQFGPAVPLPPGPPVYHHRQHPVTLGAFAQCFQPVPGTHHVVFIHPITLQPVNVCFTLPPGCAEVLVGRHSLMFEYGRSRQRIEIKFLPDGCAFVKYE